MHPTSGSVRSAPAKFRRVGVVTGACVLAAAPWAVPGIAYAHPLTPAPDTDPAQWPVLLPLLLASALYIAGFVRRSRRTGSQPRRAARAASFLSGIALLAGALIGLDAWAGRAFSAHMLQHMVLIALAPPLLLLGRPGAVWLGSLPRFWQVAAAAPLRWPPVAGFFRLAVSLPATALLHGAVLWAWHIPAAFELALRVEAVHWLEHLSLLGAGLLFWHALLRARGIALGWGVMWMLVTVIHSGMLGALITLAPRPLYGIYAAQGDAAQALADQQLAGLIMWVPMGTVYLAAALAFAARGLRRAPAS